MADRSRWLSFCKSVKPSICYSYNIGRDPGDCNQPCKRGHHVCMFCYKTDGVWLTHSANSALCPTQTRDYKIKKVELARQASNSESVPLCPSTNPPTTRPPTMIPPAGDFICGGGIGMRECVGNNLCGGGRGSQCGHGGWGGSVQGGANVSGRVSVGQGGGNRQDIQDRCGRYIVKMMHAKKCTLVLCMEQGCPEIKSLISHIQQCPGCEIRPGCLMTKKCANHWDRCQRSGCNICDPCLVVLSINRLF